MCCWFLWHSELFNVNFIPNLNHKRSWRKIFHHLSDLWSKGNGPEVIFDRYTRPSEAGGGAGGTWAPPIISICIDRLHLTSWRPCWRYNTKEYVINSIVGSSRRGRLTLSATSREIDCKPRIRQSKTLRLEKCEPNSDLLKKMKKPRLALSTLLAHMPQAISDSLFSSIPINSFPDFQFVMRFSVKYHFPGRWKSYFGGSRF